MKIPRTLKTYFAGRYFILHPILLAIFPAIFMYSYNIQETAFSQTIVPLLMSLGGAILLWIILSLIMRNAVKAGIATSVFLIFFFSYGRLYEMLKGWEGFSFKHAYFLPIMVFVCGYLIYFIAIARRNFVGLNRILNFVAAVFVIINLVTIGWHQVNGQISSSASEQHQPEAPIAKTAFENMPDVYYIILDEFAHPDTMRDYYGYDDNSFSQFLEEKGFYIATESQTKTMRTTHCIASSLNMEYIPDNERIAFVNQKINNSLVADIFRSMGYQFVYYGTWYDISADIKVDCDILLNFYNTETGKSLANEFPRIYWNATALLPFYDYVFSNQYENFYRRRIIDTFNSLRLSTEIPNRKFVFAHIMAPHDPFVFGKNDEFVDTINWNNYENKQFYLDQYIFTERNMERVISSILKTSDSPPIIIVQSDHGIRPIRPRMDVGKEEWRKIFNAYYFPGQDYSKMYKKISPVNSFRFIFHNYFGMEYNLLAE